MTSEEAITLMKSAQLMLVNPKTNEPISDLYEAFDMAIKALEQEPIYYPPCQDCHAKVNEIVRAYNNVKSLDDAISRQEAIHCVTETELYNETFAEAKMRIAELKPVLPKHESEDKE